MICFRRTGHRSFVGGFVGCPNSLRHAATITTWLFFCSFADARKKCVISSPPCPKFPSPSSLSSTVHFFCSKNRTMNCSIFFSNLLKALDEPRSFNKSHLDHLVFVHRESTANTSAHNRSSAFLPATGADNWEIPCDDSCWHQL